MLNAGKEYLCNSLNPLTVSSPSDLKASPALTTCLDTHQEEAEVKSTVEAERGGRSNEDSGLRLQKERDSSVFCSQLRASV